MNVRDVLSPYARMRKGIVVERLDRFDRSDGEWRECVLEDHQTPVFDQVQFRIDFPDWLSRLSGRDRRLALSRIIRKASWPMSAGVGYSGEAGEEIRPPFPQSG